MTGILLAGRAWSTATEQPLSNSLYYRQEWLDLLATLYGYHVNVYQLPKR